LPACIILYQSADIPLSHIRRRRVIRDFIKAGQIEEAIDALDKLNEQILKDNTLVHFE